MDGTQVEDLLPHGLIEPYGIAVAVGGGKLYWTDWEVGIQRANLDGSGVETLVREARPNGIAVDAAAGKMYWTDYGVNRIRRANLDGSRSKTWSLRRWTIPTASPWTLPAARSTGPMPAPRRFSAPTSTAPTSRTW